MNKFEKEVTERIKENGNNKLLLDSANRFFMESSLARYSYNFSVLGRPIIQYPQDMMAIKELIWKIRPDLVIETGIAHGGSLILSASMLALLDICDAIELGGKETMINPNNSKRKVLGVDNDIRSYNREAIEAHPMSSRIHMIQGSSVDPLIINQVKKVAKNYKCILVFLDSDHTHSHVFAELEAYAPLITKDSYCVVFDTVIEDLPESFFHNRAWRPGNSPKTAVWEYLKNHPEFEIDKNIQNKLLITVAPDGYIKRK